MNELELVRDVLDKELIDCEETNMGRVDGVVLDVGDGPPRVDRFELGFVVLARRVHPRVEQLAMRLRRWSVRKSARYGIPWEKVLDVTPDHIQVDLQALKTPAFDWERWMRKHIVEKLPGGKEE
jgi:hypothetical protein